ncbi:hypothetical protein M4I21_10515 [Cellulophaga sp. 20_2_10]|uniref:hypothetical protein n=1 Tax=Cellulophaga sp. 20_2_10 TaxID=2942476 RepID=UPI00201B216A|nr:hypothetical protein [Cellulophaga sp. 20_2_10]MCL5246242.1 hypothetical protein [Cellulophaga sp. 20_2_10]
MNKFYFILLLLLTVSCKGQDISINDFITQKLEAKNKKLLIIECYCDNGVTVKKTDDTLVIIKVKGNLSSLRYHGRQTAPKKIDTETLAFKVVETNDTLTIISKEWTRVHHSYVIQDLQISIPKHMTYELKKIAGVNLEGRKID